MHRAFPSFQSNYPTSLRPLGDYVAEAQADLEQRRSSGDRGTRTGVAQAWRSSGRPGSALSAASRAKSAGVERPGSALSSSLRSYGAGGGARHFGSRSTLHSAAAGTAFSGEADAADGEVEEVDLSRRSDLDAGLLQEQLAAHSNLRVINLRQAKLTEAVLEAIAQELDLTQTPAVPCFAVDKVVNACPRLMALRAGNCSHLFVDTIAARQLFASLARPAASILELRLPRCRTLTDDALLAYYQFPPPDAKTAAYAAADALYREEVARAQATAADARRVALMEAGLSAAEADAEVGAAPPSAPMKKQQSFKALGQAAVLLDGWYFDTGVKGRSDDAAEEKSAAVRKSALSANQQPVTGGAGGVRGEAEWPPKSRPPSTPLPLRCLDLTGCNKFTDVGMKHLASVCKSLLQLKLQLCDQAGLSSEAVATLLTANPQLMLVDLTGVTQLKAIAVAQMAEACPDLQHVLLAGCSHVDDSSLLALARCCPQLVTLDLSVCDNVTASTLLRCLSAWRRLMSLNITMCSKVTDDDYLRIRREFPHLNLVRHAGKYSDEHSGGLVPNYVPPPKDEQWRSVRAFATIKGGKKDKKGKKGKKKKK